MIKVPFRNPEREKERERKRESWRGRGESTDKHADRQSDRRQWGINTMADREFEELQNVKRRRIRPLRMTAHGYQAKSYTLLSLVLIILCSKSPDRHPE